MDTKTVKQLIKDYQSDQLQELILKIVSKNPAAQQALLDYCQKHGNTPKADNRTLVIENQLKHHWSQASEIIEEFNMYGGGPEDQEEAACDDLEKMIEILESEDAPWEVRREILEDVLDFVRSDNSGFSDMLIEVADSLCRTEEEQIYLADQLSQYKDSYYGRMAADIYREFGKDEKYLESKRAHLTYASDYLDLAEYYEEQGDEEQALQIVREGFEKSQGRLDEIYHYLFQHYVKNKDEKSLEKLYRDSAKKRMNQDTITELMYGYYKEKCDYGKQKVALLKLISCSNCQDLYKLYEKCRRELTPEDFAKEEKGILKTIKDKKLSVYFDILLEKNEPKEIIDYIINSGQYGGWGLDQGHYFTRRLSGRYPREVVELYWKEVAAYVKMGKEENYAHAVGVLKEICQLMKSSHWTDEWETRYQAFLEEHRRKKLLMKQLENFEV